MQIRQQLINKRQELLALPLEEYLSKSEELYTYQKEYKLSGLEKHLVSFGGKTKIFSWEGELPILEEDLVILQQEVKENTEFFLSCFDGQPLYVWDGELSDWRMENHTARLTIATLAAEWAYLLVVEENPGREELHLLLGKGIELESSPFQTNFCICSSGIPFIS